MKSRGQAKATAFGLFAPAIGVVRKIGCGLYLLLLTANFTEADIRPNASPSEKGIGPAPECPITEATLALIQHRYDSVQDLRAEFEQRSRSVVLAGTPEAAEEVSRGEVVFAKPGRMRWTYRDPEPSFVISNGETLWIYDVGASQVTRMRLEEGYLAGAALQFLFGGGRLEDVFRASTAGCGQGGIVVELVPRTPSSYERLSLTADAESGLVTSTSIVDLFGNRTTILFLGIEFNQSPRTGLFEFSLPEGVDLLDMGQRP
jgi:outer membrane lipoprotein carrier protein